MTLAKESWPFALPFALLAALLLAAGYHAWAAAALAGGVAVLAFFRIPRRRFTGAGNIVLAAGNGLVTGIETIEDAAIGPGRFVRIVTFLSVFDVHVQRIPASGEIVASRYAAGRKVAAFRADAGQVNEQHLTVIRRPNGDLIGVRQIAGLLARRVVCYARTGDLVTRGGALGLIKFGSRVDLILPVVYRVLVKKGDRLVDGATPVAQGPDNAQGSDSSPSGAASADAAP
jgi:phosphatidylserine decarboxylase